MCFYPGVKPDPPPPACEGGEAWGTLKVPGEGWTIGEGNTRGGRWTGDPYRDKGALGETGTFGARGREGHVEDPRGENGWEGGGRRGRLTPHPEERRPLAFPSTY